MINRYLPEPHHIILAFAGIVYAASPSAVTVCGFAGAMLLWITVVAANRVTELKDADSRRIADMDNRFAERLKALAADNDGIHRFVSNKLDDLTKKLDSLQNAVNIKSIGR